MKNKKNLMFAATLSVCIAVNIVGITALPVQATKGINNKTVTLPDSAYPTSDQNGKNSAINVLAKGKLYNSGSIQFNNNKATGNTKYNGRYTNGCGGAIRNAGTTVLQNVEFNNNEAAQHGGAIYNYNGTLEITNGQFNKNSARIGGAIDSEAYGLTAVIKNSTFTENFATEHGGAVTIAQSGGDMIIDNSTFSNNHANEQGGAILIEVFSNKTPDKNASLTITNSKFNNNYTDGAAGGAISNYDKLTIKNSEFTANETKSTNPADRTDKGGGGALMLGSNSETYLDDVTFNGNKSAENGGVIGTRFGGGQDNSNAKLDIYNSTFKNNESKGNGGVLDNHFFGSENNEGAITIYNSTFEGNQADDGGAIYSTDKGAMIISQSTFKNNKATYDGAIAAGLKSGNIKISDSLFEGNEALSTGAIGTFARDAKMEIENTVFRNNKATDAEDLEGGAGALFTGAESQTTLKNVTFDSNYSAAMGGAIATRGNKADNSAAKLDIDGALFVNNVADDKGGAIYNAFYDSETKPSSVSIKNAVFSGNKSGSDGGAIYNEIADQAGKIATVTITDSSFGNNTAAGKGGAIFANSDLTIEAINQDVVFAGNKATDGSDIYMNKADSTLNLNVVEDRAITIASGISGSEGYKINVDGGGLLDVHSEIKNANMSINNGSGLWLNSNSILTNTHVTLNDSSELATINNQIDKFAENTFTVNGEVYIATDVNVENGIGDNLGEATTFGEGATLTLDHINPIGNVTADKVNIDLYKALGLDPEKLTIDSTFATVGEVMTPIRKFAGSISETGMLTMAPTGNGYKDFNPAVMASPIAAQLGGYLTQLNSYDEAFRNMDMYMLMTKKQRQAMKLRNKYAAADSHLTFDPTGTPYSDKAGWVRPYATFENVRLKGGPRVSNVAYGSFFGADSELYDLGHGWDGMWGAYVGYNGSHQSYNGISMYQNGGTLGAVGMAYKGDFFTGLTINTSANGAEASTMYGTDNFSMLMAGIASKTGYNFEMADGKFIIQPNFLMSYSFVNTFDYTNAAGVRISSDPLNAIQIEPGLKFIGNLKNGWQPYASISMVWNIMDKTDFHANDVSLPELSVKPFVRYGIGVRKTWGERFCGFLQAYFTNGGRNGVGFQTGLRWTFGKSGSAVSKQNKTPQPKKTQIKLSSSK